jgi:hypothetical protein
MSELLLLKAAHSSGQFSDSDAQQHNDAERLVRRMGQRQWRWLTGTEAGSQSSLDVAFRGIDDESGLKFHKDPAADVWALVRKDLFQKGSVEQQFYKVIDAAAGLFGNRGVFRLSGRCSLVGADLTILVGHYLTAEGAKQSHHLDGNKRIAAKIGDLAREYGKGRDLVFYGGDQNEQDRKVDTFHGQPMTSLADELKRWKDTGHGSIDVMASYNQDKRVTGKSWMVFDDEEFALHTDHWLCEGSWNVEMHVGHSH